jgi:predicted metal-dependent hydrolase
MLFKESRQANINGRQVPYTLKRSTRARYARLEVSPEHGLTIIIPAFDNLNHVRQLLEEKRRWIIEKLEKYSSATTSNKPGLGSDTVPYLGCNMKIEKRPGDTESVSLDRENSKLRVIPGPDGLRSTIERWYRTEAKMKITRIVEEKSRFMGLSYQRITIKGQKTLWGSCSKKHNLNFNWRLLMAPEPIIDYVVVHELAHLKVMSHSKRFWQTVGKYCPDWRIHRTWLREHSHELSRKLRE